LRRFTIALLSGEDQPPKSDLVTGIPKHDGQGFLLIPDTPGISVELQLDALAKCPMKPREVVTRLHVDGSVVDQ
jgi:galactonate dehydratase